MPSCDAMRAGEIGQTGVREPPKSTHANGAAAHLDQVVVALAAWLAAVELPGQALHEPKAVPRREAPAVLPVAGRQEAARELPLVDRRGELPVDVAAAVVQDRMPPPPLLLLVDVPADGECQE